MIFTIFILPSLMEFEIIGPWLLRILLLLFFFIGIWSTQNKVLRNTSAGLFLVALFLKIIDDFTPVASTEIINSLARVLNISIFIVINLGLLFRNDSINFERILGAINVYFLFALLGAFSFQFIHMVFGSSIEGPETLASGDSDFPHYIYFCLTSLTTVGFGDYVPVNFAAKMLSVALSTVGILFPAIVIARLVSKADFSRKK